jgi:hypothetical protein
VITAAAALVGLGVAGGFGIIDARAGGADPMADLPPLPPGPPNAPNALACGGGVSKADLETESTRGLRRHRRRRGRLGAG